MHSIAESILIWYDNHHRDLPWRIAPADGAQGVKADPYRIWLSEVMLQQTTVVTVKPYFEKFTALWPDVEALANAREDDVMAAWAGLGYYSRARNLHKCAQKIVAEFGGHFPSSKSALLTLPGVGDYTAAAIASIAFDLPETVIDGNIERVTARLGAIATPLPHGRKEIAQLAAAHTPQYRAGDFAQAMMDLGASICVPRTPKCLLCPLAPQCQARALGIADRLPIKAKKPPKPDRAGAVFVARRTTDHALYLRKRPNKGLLGGMAELPTTDWTSQHDGSVIIDAAPFAAEWRNVGAVSHVFTHFRLVLTVYYSDISAEYAAQLNELEGWWSQTPDEEALPTLFTKALQRALSDQP